MATQVLMPALSPTMEKGNLAKWIKNEGDKVKAGDVIAEIETDKATMEVEAVDEGTLGKILVPEGTADVAVNTPIAGIFGEGGSAAGRGPPPRMSPPTRGRGCFGAGARAPPTSRRMGPPPRSRRRRSPHRPPSPRRRRRHPRSRTSRPPRRWSRRSPNPTC